MKHNEIQPDDRRAQPRRRSAMAKFAAPAHKRAARAIGFALTIFTEAAAWQLAALLGVILAPRERAFLAFSLLVSLDRQDAHQVAETALFQTRWPT